ncbi:unnamed protein product [Gordionus sp. m RMFG-2023]
MSSPSPECGSQWVGAENEMETAVQCFRYGREAHFSWDCSQMGLTRRRGVNAKEIGSGVQNIGERTGPNPGDNREWRSREDKL